MIAGESEREEEDEVGVEAKGDEHLGEGGWERCR